MKNFFLLLFLLLAPLWSFAADVAPEKLGAEMGARITRVPEFEFIREEAAKLGVRVYLFGGTAAAYGHYVRQDLAREAGDKHYPDFFYDYDYTNIFRSTQDLDVVIDGPAEKAAQLERLLKEKFPHFIGDKAAKWEVRSLREARGDKEAILGNPDFANQHTDSHSTGMVEVTATPSGDIPVKDVRDWESKKPQFLTDVAEQKLHYYFNPFHGSTRRAKDGMNPPILSAIRYLTKAFQYDLEISGEDRARIQEIVRNFTPADLKNDYVKSWIEKNSKKLFQHAVDIDYAAKTLDDLGLRAKLAAIRHDAEKVDSLSWWMNKEPLGAEPIGKGSGKTAAQIARELGLDTLIVSHESNSFLSYESITRSKAGELNAFTSRPGAAGENALGGKGFYTQLGRSGARGSGFTIRMEIDPTAREGTDFIFDKANHFFLLQNKNAVRVIPEQINLSLPQYFRQLAQEKEFSSDDKALLEAFKRKTSNRLAMSQEDEEEILQIVKAEIKKSAPNLTVITEWMSLPQSARHPELIEAMMKRLGSTADLQIVLAVTTMLGSKPAQTIPEWWDWTKKFIHYMKDQGLEEMVEKKLLDNPEARRHADWMYTLRHLDTQESRIIRKAALAEPQWLKHPDFSDIFWELFNNPYAKGGRGINRADLIEKVFSQPESVAHAEILERLMTVEKSEYLSTVAKYALTQPHWQAYPKWKEWAEEILKTNLDAAYPLLQTEEAAKHPEWMEEKIKAGLGPRLISQEVLTKKIWQKDPHWGEWIRAIVQGDTPALPMMDYLRDPDEPINKYLLNPDLERHQDLKNLVGHRELNAKNLRKAFAQGYRVGEVRQGSGFRASCAKFFKFFQPSIDGG